MEYGRNPNKGEDMQNKTKKFKMLGNLLNQLKLTFFNFIKSEETAKIYKEFIKIRAKYSSLENYEKK